jgi:hypothetical protein
MLPKKLPLSCRRVVLTMADTPHIENRLRAVIDYQKPRHIVAGAVMGAVAGATVFGLIVAALRPANPEPTHLAVIENQLREIREEIRQTSTLTVTPLNEIPRGGTHTEWVKTMDCRTCHRTEKSFRPRERRLLVERTEQMVRHLRDVSEQPKTQERKPPLLLP